MIVIGIDPGPENSAYVIWDGERILSFAKEPNVTVLSRLINEGGFDRLVIEMIASYGMAVGAEVFETVYWIGRFSQAFGALRSDRVTRLIVKQHLCHDSRAKDGNIRQALIDRFGPPGKKKAPGFTYGISGDEWQALALAVTWWDLNVGSRTGGEDCHARTQQTDIMPGL